MEKKNCANNAYIVRSMQVIIVSGMFNLFLVFAKKPSKSFNWIESYKRWFVGIFAPFSKTNCRWLVTTVGSYVVLTAQVLKL